MRSDFEIIVKLFIFNPKALLQLQTFLASSLVHWWTSLKGRGGPHLSVERISVLRPPLQRAWAGVRWVNPGYQLLTSERNTWLLGGIRWSRREKTKRKGLVSGDNGSRGSKGLGGTSRPESQGNSVTHTRCHFLTEIPNQWKESENSWEMESALVLCNLSTHKFFSL